MVKSAPIQSTEKSSSSSPAEHETTGHGSFVRSFAQKAFGMAVALVAVMRSHPGSSAAIAGGLVTAGALQRFSNLDPRAQGHSAAVSKFKSVAATHSLKSSPALGTRVLVIDSPVGDEVDPTHSQDVAYVANRHLDHSNKVATLLYTPGHSKPNSDAEKLCNLADLFTKVSGQENPPAVVVSAVGKNSASKLRNLEKEIQKFSPHYQGAKPVYPISSLRQEANRLLRRLPAEFEKDKNVQCSNRLPVEKHLSNSMKALVDAGVTVVVATNNDGMLYESLKNLGVSDPDSAFDAIGYGRVSPDTPGVIVVGGVGQNRQGVNTLHTGVGPSSTVDVAALSENVQVNSHGEVSSGVSFAAPQVAAIAANIKAINPKLNPAQIEQIIKETATPLPGHENRVGAGAVNPQRAYVKARESRSIFQRLGLN